MNIIKHDWKWAHGLVTREVTDAIVIHHSAGHGDADAIHKLHINNGWAGIGYAFYIRKNGEIHEGRPTWARGAQVLNHNWHTIGICCEGNYHISGTVMPKAQMASLHEVLTYLKGLYPGATIKFHRDYGGSVCPGDYFPYAEAANYGQASASITPTTKPANNNSEKEIPDMNMLKKGSKGYQVKVAQTLLILNGYSCGPYCADGDFGGATHAATVKYQKDHDLAADGIIGPKTWACLLGC